MIINAIKTDRVKPNTVSIYEVLERYLPKLGENSVVAITSKIISLCENRVVEQSSTDLLTQIQNESEFYLDEPGQYNQYLTVTNRTLVSKSGIDNSIGHKYFILLPKDPQQTANKIREYLVAKTKLNNLGIVITDSISIPFKYGAIGTAVAFSGFEPINETPGSKANVAMGLAGAAVLEMGEAAQLTPIAIINNPEQVNFVARNPNQKELQLMNLGMDEDLFAPILNKSNWKKGRNY